jgi:hypothetical protein
LSLKALILSGNGLFRLKILGNGLIYFYSNIEGYSFWFGVKSAIRRVRFGCVKVPVNTRSAAVLAGYRVAQGVAAIEGGLRLVPTSHHILKCGRISNCARAPQ